MFEIPKVSLCETQILRKIKFGNFRMSKSAILVISEALPFDFWENSTFESDKKIIKILGWYFKPNCTTWPLNKQLVLIECIWSVLGTQFLLNIKMLDKTRLLGCYGAQKQSLLVEKFYLWVIWAETIYKPRAVYAWSTWQVSSKLVVRFLRYEVTRYRGTFILYL